jgi:hypothetical protein
MAVDEEAAPVGRELLAGGSYGVSWRCQLACCLRALCVALTLQYSASKRVSLSFGRNKLVVTNPTICVLALQRRLSGYGSGRRLSGYGSGRRLSAYGSSHRRQALSSGPGRDLLAGSYGSSH